MRRTAFLLTAMAFLCLAGGEGLFAQQIYVDSLQKLLRKVDEESNEGIHLLNQLTIALSKVNPPEAAINADRAIVIAEQLNNQKELAVAYRNKGTVLQRFGSTDKAIEHHNKSLSISKTLNDPVGMAVTNLELSRSMRFLGNGDSALKMVQNSIPILEEARELKEATWAYYLMGKYQSYLGQDSLAHLSIERSMELAVQTGNKEMRGRNLEALSELASNRSDHQTSITLGEQSLEIAEEIGDYVLIGLATGVLISSYSAMPNYPKALEYSLLSLNTDLMLHDSINIAWDYAYIGSLYLQLNMTDKAEEYNQKAVTIKEKINNLDVDYGQAILNLGRISMLRKDYSRAMDLFTKAKKIYSDQSLSRQIGTPTNYQGQVSYQLGDYRGAIARLEEALNYNTQVKYKNQLCWDHFWLGKAIYHAPDSVLSAFSIPVAQRQQLAMDHLNQAIEIGKEGNLKEVQRDAYELLSTIYRKEGDMTKAFDCLNAHLLYRDSILNFETTNQIAVMQMEYDNEQREKLLKAEQEKKDAVAQAEIAKQKVQRNGLLAGFTVVTLLAALIFRQRNKIAKARKRSDELLLNILPDEVAEELKEKGTADAKQIENVTVMFTDFKGFTQISERLSPKELVDEIHTCFKAFDEIIARHNIEKIKTIGDSYMCAGGLPVPNSTHAVDIVLAAREIQQFMVEHTEQRKREGKEVFEIRIGIHTGPVVAGIVGIKKFAYDIWGDTVNIASRMESSGEPGKVNISGATYELVKDKFRCTPRGKVQAKNKGEIEMYYVEGRMAS